MWTSTMEVRETQMRITPQKALKINTHFTQDYDSLLFSMVNFNQKVQDIYIAGKTLREAKLF